MEAYEYQTLFEFESFYWWYHGLHGILLDQLRALDLPVGARILDAGCGTGKNLANIQAERRYEPFGFDFSIHASAFWKERAVERACTASINEIPFRDDVFDAVMSVDVLESDAVNEASASAELWRVTKPGGCILLVVPAYDWLLTQEHHRAVHASRRYTQRRAVALFEHQPVEIVRATYFFTLLFPAIAAYRLMLRQRRSSSSTPRSELKPLPTPVNRVLKAVMMLERRALVVGNLPFGSSILVVARKVAA